MGEGTSSSAESDRRPASRAEIDALGDVITATIAMALRARSGAAAALLERALERLDERVQTMAASADDPRRRSFKPF